MTQNAAIYKNLFCFGSLIPVLKRCSQSYAQNLWTKTIQVVAENRLAGYIMPLVWILAGCCNSIMFAISVLKIDLKCLFTPCELRSSSNLCLGLAALLTKFNSLLGYMFWISGCFSLINEENIACYL